MYFILKTEKYKEFFFYIKYNIFVNFHVYIIYYSSGVILIKITRKFSPRYCFFPLLISISIFFIPYGYGNVLYSVINVHDPQRLNEI